MPVPQQMGKGDRMGRGPYEKSGLLEDTSLPPLRTITQSYDIFFPVKVEEKDGKKVSTIASDSMDVEVKLWYLPYGTMDDDPFLWKEFKKTVKISTSGK
ncbi:MAG: hypothetical protein J0665_17465 [Deltaproteobacteria bacterium]|jgi:hypothetical protein|nr:hypothetical protein [Deltaproteobacteria bacterium]